MAVVKDFGPMDYGTLYTLGRHRLNKGEAVVEFRKE